MGIPNQVQKELGIPKRYAGVTVIMTSMVNAILTVNFPSTAQKLSESCFHKAPRSR